MLFVCLYLYIFYFQIERSDDLLMLHTGPLIKNVLRVKVFSDILFLSGENVSLEEIRISAVSLPNHV